MKLDVEGIRGLISGSLLVFLTVVAVYLWFIDLLAEQRIFSLLLSAELVAFAMLVYVSAKPSYNDVSKAWFFLGCLALVGLLLLTITV